MAKQLVIVESPAKAKTIEKFLGKGFQVLSSKGHIRDLKKKDFGIDLDTFEPQYEIAADKKQTVSELRSAAKKADSVWLASDEDREGEAISWHLAEVLGLDPATAQRIVFHEITQPAIEYAIQHPRHIDLRLVDAQQARRVLDRLVGFKISPVLWRKVRPNLSAGRVQSVAVRLIVEREREIQAFRSEAAYRVTAVFRLPQGGVLNAVYADRFGSREEAMRFLDRCRTATFTIRSVTKKPTKRTPAPPFTTSTLQQEAARKLGFSVSLTMSVAQALYEMGHITYMRTDSMNLSQLALNTAAQQIEKTMGANYAKRRRFHTKAKGAQEAHEAIRPTYIDREKIAELTVPQRRLYELIWKRTIACQMADAELEKTTVEIEIDDRQTAGGAPLKTFTATGEVVLFDGFLKVYRESVEQDSENDDEGRLLPPMQEGETIEREEIVAQERFSQAPARYNEASLVHKLEELGIGRPSTYAPTISTIQQREYVVRGTNEGAPRPYTVLTLKGEEVGAEEKTEMTGGDKGRLVPTDTGTVVNDFLMDYFADIIDYNFTANIEREFDAVAEGKEDWVKLVRSFYNDFEPKVEQILEQKSDHRVGERVLGNDPASGRQVSVRIGRFGPMVQIGTATDDDKPRFATLKRTQSIQTITLEEALELFRLPRILGEYEGKEVQVNEGRFGPYVRHAGLYAGLPKGEDPMDIDLDRAIEIIELKRKAEREKHIKHFDEEPELEILNGRWGPYIAYKGNNYRIPKTRHAQAADLTYADCLKLIEADSKKKKKK